MTKDNTVEILFTEREAQDLAEKHWDFIHTLLILAGEKEEILEIAGYLYRQAMIHGIRHAQKRLESIR